MSISTKVKQMTDTGYMMVDKAKNKVKEIGKKVIWRVRGGEYTDRMNARQKRFDELNEERLRRKK